MKRPVFHIYLRTKYTLFIVRFNLFERRLCRNYNLHGINPLTPELNTTSQRCLT
jgi:hypothetical protein